MKASPKQPLKPQQLYVLLALADRDRHGSGIMRETLDLSEGQLRLWPAMLYSTLEQLAREGWIKELGKDERPPNSSERRRYYRVTPAGREILALETERLFRLVQLARHRNRLSPETPA